MKPYKRPYGGTPGAPVMYEKPSDPEDEGAGYGYSNAEQIKEKDVFFYHSDHLGSTSYITDLQGNATQFVSYKPYGETLVDEHNTSYEQPWKFNGKELDNETGLYYYGARYYEPVLAMWYGVDALAEKYTSVGGYVYCAGNPVKLVDPDGDSPTLATAAIGAVLGGIVGGAIEIGSQLYQNGEVSDWSAVGGASAQGAITGAAAGLTCGASLVITAGVSSASNVIGGVVNREIQGKETTATNIITDATIGGVAGTVGKGLGQLVKKGLDTSTAATKGKIGEATTQIKYALEGYKSNGKAVVETGKTTATGRTQVAKYDFEMENVFTGRTITVESKFNTSGLTPNQKAALSNVKTPFVIDRTTSAQFQKGVQSTVNYGVQQGTNRLNND